MSEAREPGVRDYMSTQLVTLDPEMDVLLAMRTFLQRGISGAPVVDAHGSLLGILTQRDCMNVAMQAIYHREPGGRVAEAMSAPVETLPAGATLAEAIEAFRGSRYRRFPVVDDGGRLVGQISRRDILQAVLDLW